MDECRWTQDHDPDQGDAWDTECGERFLLVEGTPKENDFRFCCYCGKPLVEVL